MEKIVYELKGMLEMLEYCFEDDEGMTYDQFKAISNRVNELTEIIETNSGNI